MIRSHLLLPSLPRQCARRQAMEHINHSLCDYSSLLLTLYSPPLPSPPLPSPPLPAQAGHGAHQRLRRPLRPHFLPGAVGPQPPLRPRRHTGAEGRRVGVAGAGCDAGAGWKPRGQLQEWEGPDGDGDCNLVHTGVGMGHVFTQVWGMGSRRCWACREGYCRRSDWYKRAMGGRCRRKYRLLIHRAM